MIPTKQISIAICHVQKRVMNIKFKPADALQSIKIIHCLPRVLKLVSCCNFILNREIKAVYVLPKIPVTQIAYVATSQQSLNGRVPNPPINL